jgi:hypothetical protein
VDNFIGGYRGCAFKDSMNIVKTNYLTGLLKTMELEEIEQILGSLRKLNSLMENSR